jgi:hypothetical protein
VINTDDEAESAGAPRFYIGNRVLHSRGTN